MSEDSQAEVVDFLSHPAAYGIETDVETIETHISRVFLAGDRVYKLKRAVRFSYLDFSTVAARKQACEDELRLNRRTAPDVYLAVVPVTRAESGRLAIDGDGEAADWLVAMRRFDQGRLLDRLAQRDGALTREHMETLAESLHDFHEDAEIDRTRGGHAAMRGIASDNADNLERFGTGELDADEIAHVRAESDAQLARIGALLDRRRDNGRVRRCHGDLHLRNIVMIDGKPTPFDCIEFNDDFSIIDVLYDLAFLIMDLEHRGLRGHANALLNRTLDLSGDGAALACLPLFLSMRAAIRAHVDAARAVQAGEDGEEETARQVFSDARSYLDLAAGFLRPPAPRLVAVGGLSGSGKSSLARRVAPALGAAPGAAVIRSDVTRKRLAGVGMYDRLDPSGYTREMTAKVYARLIADARTALEAGHAVVLDAVYADPEERRGARALADELGVPFDGLWLDVPHTVRAARIGERVGDASDATAEISRRQEEMDLGPMDWQVLDAAADLDTLAERATKLLVNKNL